MQTTIKQCRSAQWPAGDRRHSHANSLQSTILLSIRGMNHAQWPWRISWSCLHDINYANAINYVFAFNSVTVMCDMRPNVLRVHRQNAHLVCFCSMPSRLSLKRYKWLILCKRMELLSAIAAYLWTPKSDGEHRQRQQTNSERSKNCSYLNIKYTMCRVEQWQSNETFRKCLHCIPVQCARI